ncbi:hypothetical protein DL240_12670 [Lujinxingia litoralis]|uniref:Right handed beta helix domain-containing protein n=1 Tax=Lujinxingia litoralis TaxID=2211119 RepID=A0A328C5X1_9DELT|nr:hypothetical protein DL240_12670 [Lujinxingia litoralis]
MQITLENPQPRPQAYTFETTSNQVEIRTPTLRLPPYSTSQMELLLTCPSRPGVYRLTVEIRALHSRTEARLPIELSCTQATTDRSMLGITLAGVPADATAPVFITDARRDSTHLSSGASHELLPGSYRLRAPDLEIQGEMFTPELRELEVELLPGQHADLKIAYAPLFARSGAKLQVSPAGLPPGARVHATLRTPSGISLAVSTGTPIENLPPGTYTLRYGWAHARNADGSPWLGRPLPPEHTLELDERSRIELRPTYIDARMISEPADHGPGSLRRALNEAVAGTTFFLDDTVDEVVLDAPLHISADATLVGGASPPRRITTRGAHGAFLIEKHASLTLAGLTLKECAGPHAPAIEAYGALDLLDVTIADSRTISTPAAIRAHTTLSAVGLKLHNNHSDEATGGIWVGPDALAWIQNLEAVHNIGQAGGAARVLGELTLRDSNFTLNQARRGGAMDIPGVLRADRVGFWFNRTSHQAGPGGALLSGGASHLSNATFGYNLARQGGAIHTQGTLDLRFSTFFQNQADRDATISLTDRARVSVNTSLILGGSADNEHYVKTTTSASTNFRHAPEGSILYRNGLPTAAAPARLGTELLLPPEQCASLHDDDLRLDQLGTPRFTETYCTPGAVELASPRTLLDHLQPGPLANRPHTGFFVSKQGLTYHFQNAYREHGALHLSTGSIQTQLSGRGHLCHASFLLEMPDDTLPRVALSSTPPGQTLATIAVAPRRWRVDLSTPTPIQTLHLATHSPQVTLLEVQLLATGCDRGPGLDTPSTDSNLPEVTSLP